MAEMQVAEKGGKGGKVRSKKLSTRVDLTPMVDLAFLLITFFMLTTTLSKPQIMPVVMPEKKLEDLEEFQATKESQVITLMLGANDKVYYYEGITDPKLDSTDYSAEGLRKVILDKKVEQLVSKIDIVNAIIPITMQISRSKVLPTLPKSIDDFRTFLTEAIPLCQRSQRSACIDTVNSPSHAQRIEVLSRRDPEVPRQDRSIELHVVAKQRGVSPVNLVEPSLSLFLRTAEPHGSIVINLHRHANHFKARVVDVLLGRELLQPVVRGIVSFKI
jgi:biopolymer transport protein ExbD